MKRELILGTVLASALCLAAAGPADADPSNGAFHVTLGCDDGHTYDVVFRASADWNVNLDTNSNAVFVPTAFQFNAELLDALGNVLAERHDPWLFKGKSTGRQPNEIACTFNFFVPRGDGTQGHFFGPLLAHVTPAA